MGTAAVPQAGDIPLAERFGAHNLLKSYFCAQYTRWKLGVNTCYCIVLPTNWLHTLDQVQVMLLEMGQVFYFYNMSRCWSVKRRELCGLSYIGWCMLSVIQVNCMLPSDCAGNLHMFCNIVNFVNTEFSCLQ